MKDTLEQMQKNLQRAERNEEKALQAVGKFQQTIQAHKAQIENHWREIEKLIADKSKFTELLRASLAVRQLQADIEEIEGTKAQ